MSEPTLQVGHGTSTAGGPLHDLVPRPRVEYVAYSPEFPVRPTSYDAPIGSLHPVEAPQTAKRSRLVPALIVALLLALVGGAVAVTLLLTSEPDSSVSAGNGSSSLDQDSRPDVRETDDEVAVYTPPVTSGQTASEREFIADAESYATFPGASESTLIDVGHSTCEYLDSTSGSPAAVESAVDMGIEAGLTQSQSMAIVASAVVNFCPEYQF
ncbi:MULTISPECIES: DUF732 domain-containing protein [unclassified Blastococcus]